MKRQPDCTASFQRGKVNVNGGMVKSDRMVIICRTVQEPPEVVADGLGTRARGEITDEAPVALCEAGSAGCPAGRTVARWMIRGGGSFRAAHARSGDGYGGGWHRPDVCDGVLPPGSMSVSRGLTGFRCRHGRYAPPGGAESAVDAEIQGGSRRSVHKYGIIPHWSSEDWLFLAAVAGLPGCIAHGDVQAITLRNIKEVMKLRTGRARELGHPVPAGSRSARSGSCGSRLLTRHRIAGALSAVIRPVPAARSSSRMGASIHGSRWPTGPEDTSGPRS